jgi:hypothetical protein
VSVEIKDQMVPKVIQVFMEIMALMERMDLMGPRVTQVILGQRAMMACLVLTVLTVHMEFQEFPVKMVQIA